MNIVTENLLRRAATQAACLARQNAARGVSIDKTLHAQVAEVPFVPEIVARETDPVEVTQKTIKDLPGPNGYPIIGTAPEYFRKENRGQMHEVQRRFHARFGRIFKEQLGPVTNLSIADPKLVEELLRSEGKFPNRPPYEAWLLYKEMRKRSKGIMSATGEEWHKIRTLLNKRLLKPVAVQQHFVDLNSISQQLTDKLKRVRDSEGDGKVVPDILNVLYAWSIESIGQVLLDKRFGCLNADMPDSMNEFVRAIEVMMYTSHQMMVFSNVHKTFNTKPWRSHVKSWDTILDVAKNILDSKREEIETRLDGDSSEELTNSTLFDHLLSSPTLTTEEVYTNMTELLLSGVDTTANTVSVALYLLSNHPHVQQKLQQEVDATCSSSTDNGFTQENIKHMPYLKAFVKEVHRLYPVIPTNARMLTEDTVIDGHLIPKNTIVMLNTFTMCRDSDEFDRPDEFIPERWLRNEVRDFSPFTSLPFGFGARSCIGRRVAETMLYLSLANITKKYTMIPVEGSEVVKPFVRTVLTLGEDLPVQFIDR